MDNTLYTVETTSTSTKKTRLTQEERAQRKEQENQKLAANAEREGIERKKAADALKTLQLSASRTAETTYNAGKALLAIKDDKLYKTPHEGEAYSSFKIYVGVMFKISEQYAYMLINAAKVQDVLFEAEVTQKFVSEKLLRKLTGMIHGEEGKHKIAEIWKSATGGKLDKIPTDKELSDLIAESKPKNDASSSKSDSDILNDPDADNDAIINLLRRLSSGKSHLSRAQLTLLKSRVNAICDNAEATEE